MADKKKKMPPQLLEYFKNKNKKKEDGKEMSDKEKRKDITNYNNLVRNHKIAQNQLEKDKFN